jgi:hypothetical protein
MGGLSYLQRRVLFLCLDNRFLSVEEILSSWRDWKPAEWGSIIATVGAGEYNVGHASLSRTTTRLWRRGLVVIWKNLTNSATGITLTDAGKALAQAISEEETIDGNSG